MEEWTGVPLTLRRVVNAALETTGAQFAIGRPYDRPFGMRCLSHPCPFFAWISPEPSVVVAEGRGGASAGRDEGNRMVIYSSER